ncbi:hypothetical protein HAX54_044075 [Datura stramonium]|uniref:Uncharacterized protein n=1 Tax=Datura stramonium TaxID=4076 RepID=A0ABS8SNV3_DATST|nr:hypothetical protein [Datura stramonium]
MKRRKCACCWPEQNGTSGGSPMIAVVVGEEMREMRVRLRGGCCFGVEEGCWCGGDGGEKKMVFVGERIVKGGGDWGEENVQQFRD